MAEEKMSAEQILEKILEKDSAGKYREDVAHVSESLQKGTYSKRDFLCDDLYKFIEQIDPEDGKVPAFGKNVTLDGKDEEACFTLLNQILSLENAPLGAWPAKEMDTLWQQADVNLSIHKGSGEVFEETGSVIAAKEKTDEDKEDILKELLADNVVERAGLLAECDKPDDAFQSFDFYHGEEKNHAYAEYPAKWHRIREDRLNEYSAVLASDDLKALQKVCKDFNQDEKTMGRVAAVWSDEAARKEFFEKVIMPYVNKIRETDLTVDRIPAYKKAREEFLAQKKAVLDLREKMGKLQKLFLRNWQEDKMQNKALKAAQAQIEHSQKDAQDAENNRQPLTEQRDKIAEQMDELLWKIQDASSEAQAAKNEWNRCNDLVRTGFDRELELRNSVNAMTKLLNKKKYDSVMEEADKIQQEAIEAQEKAPLAEKKMKELSAQYDELVAQKEIIQKNQEAVLDKISQISKTINDARSIIARKEEEAEQIKASLESIKKERDDILDSWSKEEGEDHRSMLDNAFVKDLLSGDDKLSEQRKKDNPWISRRYQKEREKLFVLALEFHKAFAEASGCLAANLATLSQYLGYWKKGDEKIAFHEADREETVPFLWQSLFLFLPMMETEFSSVSELFADAKKPGLFGLLALEDVDGTDPAKFIGAAYRGRRAVVFSK